MADKKENTNSKKNPASLLDLMENGREYESLIRNKAIIQDVEYEIKTAFTEIKKIRGREVICYAGNVVNQYIKGSKSIDNTDDLPFSEMINSLPSEAVELDVILITGGGSPQQVVKFVDKLRFRNRKITFIIPSIAMSAGTIFALSGDEIIMGQNSYLGPIDPQILNKDGTFVPAQTLLTLLDDIEEKLKEATKKKESPKATDIHLLRNIDPYRVGIAKTASESITNIVKDYLINYKLKNWTIHDDTKKIVTDDERKEAANRIATAFCNHSKWKVHDRGITRDDAWSLCQLKITYTESQDGLDQVIKRFWALLYFIFEKTQICKIYASSNYFVTK